MQQVSNGILSRQPSDRAYHSGTLVGKTADAENLSEETEPSQRNLASATSLGQQSAAGTCLTVAPSLNDGALPVDSTSKPSGLEPACIGAPVNADVAFNQNERALEIRCANCSRLGHASNVDPRCPFHGRERGQIAADIGSSLCSDISARFAAWNTSTEGSTDAPQQTTAPQDVKPRVFFNLGFSCWINACLQALWSPIVVKLELHRIFNALPSGERERLVVANSERNRFDRCWSKPDGSLESLRPRSGDTGAEQHM